ncbi:MAG TPA: tripartite tricarboxylate transporter substrate binding protein [Clostridia bacterium]|nr:tripartite tricarboxylate transporter substrate binding protein [Clostridia bacterium]
MQGRKSLIFLLILVLAVGLITAGCGGGGEAEGEIEYPTKPITIIVPWNAGGDTDAIWRTVGKYLEEELGQTIVIKNIGGGSGAVGAQEALQAKPDGYTLLAGHDSIALSYVTGKTDFGYFDFAPVALMTTTPDIVGTASSSEFTNMEEVVAYAKEHPGELTFGASLGSTSHYTPAAIEVAADIEFNIVGYEGTADRMTALLGGHINFGSVSVPAAKEYLEAGQMTLLGIASEERHPSLPDLPTLKEQGIDVLCGTNRGLFAPKDTPQEIIDILRDALEKVANNPEFKEAIEQQGTDVNFMGDDYADWLKANEEEMDKVAKESGMLDDI